MHFDYLKFKPRAINFLAEHLNKGTLVLFLGSGASKDLGLPDWLDFVNNIRKRKGMSLVSSNASAEDLQLAIDEVKDKIASNRDFLVLLKDELYKGKLKKLSTHVIKNDLLISLGALLMGSNRGNIRRVITLNFDSMLEWFLLLHGFDVNVVHRLPVLEGSEDVRIYHPHGFLPHDSLNYNDSDFIIFGMDSVNERLGKLGEPWFELTRHLMKTGVCLFVGMSKRTFFDRSLAPLIKTVGEEVIVDRPLGIWLLKENLDPNEESRFINNNVIPLTFRYKKHIADFILKICQKAVKAFILF